MRVFVACCLLLLSACSREPLYHSQSYIFGTLVDISIYGEEQQRAQALSDQVFKDFQALHDRLHAWQDNSELSRLNRAFAAGTAPVPIDDELARMLEDATAWSVRSGGKFNPAIGQLIEQWGFQRDEFTPVAIDDAAIGALVNADPQMTDIVIQGRLVFSKNPSVKLDLGGYAKGYALDRAADYLRSKGVKHALVNIGGNIIALGKHGEHAWRVGIQHPRKPGPIATLDLEDGWAIGTSGDYQRYFELNGKRFCHLIDPATGYPADQTQSVTILVPPAPNSGVVSDVASKPIFLATPDQRAEASERMGIDHVMLIDAAGRISVSTSMAKKLRWVDEDVRSETLF
jgi:thiamine biosynthesis lipoprotein